MTNAPTTPSAPVGRSAIVAAVIDLVAIIVFTAIGRSSHAESFDVLGFMTTLWPFFAGSAIGWVLTRSWRSPTRIWPNGVLIWVNTIIFGMFLRALTGQGVQVSFVIVASIATGILLIGWRLVAHFAARARAKRQG